MDRASYRKATVGEIPCEKCSRSIPPGGPWNSQGKRWVCRIVRYGYCRRVEIKCVGRLHTCKDALAATEAK